MILVPGSFLRSAVFYNVTNNITLLLTVCILGISYGITDVNVTFVNHNSTLVINSKSFFSNYSSYKIKLHRELRQRTDCQEKDTIFWQEVQGNMTYVIPLAGYVHKGNYCVQASPFKLRNGEIKEIHSESEYKTFRVPDSGLRAPNCSSPVISFFFLDPDHDKKTLTARFDFTPLECMLQVFHIEVDLYSTFNHNCSNNTAINFIMSEKLFQRLPNGTNIAVFRNLSNASYCAQIIIDNADCNTRCTLKKDMSYPVLLGKKDDEANPDENVPFWYITVTLSIISLMLLIFTIILVKKFSHSKCYLNSEDFHMDDPTAESIYTEAIEKAKKLEIVLLYSRDCEQHTAAVASFREFLLNSWRVKKVKCDCEEEHLIALNPCEWVEETIANKTNRKFVIVESDELVQQMKNIINTNENPEEDYLALILRYALNRIRSDERALNDYSNIFVARFPNTSCEHCDVLVPCRRYNVPKNLFDLYYDILELPQTNQATLDEFKKLMFKKWNNALI